LLDEVSGDAGAWCSVRRGQCLVLCAQCPGYMNLTTDFSKIV